MQYTNYAISRLNRQAERAGRTGRHTAHKALPAPLFALLRPCLSKKSITGIVPAHYAEHLHYPFSYSPGLPPTCRFAPWSPDLYPWPGPCPNLTFAVPLHIHPAMLWATAIPCPGCHQQASHRCPKKRSTTSHKSAANQTTHSPHQQAGKPKGRNHGKGPYFSQSTPSRARVAGRLQRPCQQCAARFHAAQLVEF